MCCNKGYIFADAAGYVFLESIVRFKYLETTLVRLCGPPPKNSLPHSALQQFRQLCAIQELLWSGMLKLPISYLFLALITSKPSHIHAQRGNRCAKCADGDSPCLQGLKPRDTAAWVLLSLQVHHTTGTSHTQMRDPECVAPALSAAFPVVASTDRMCVIMCVT